MDKKIHETQPDSHPITNNGHTVVNEMIEEAQRIEGGGPPRKVDLRTMPTPIKFFGYFFISCVIIMGIVVIFIMIFDK